MKDADVSSRSYSEAAMKLREALITQSPSLELQRAAANEIARLDAQVKSMERSTEMESQSRGMFIARLEAAQQNGDKWMTVPAVLALLNDCDFCASRS